MNYYIKYMILQADNVPALEAKVETFMKVGWSIVGGMSVTLSQAGSPNFYQAIAK